MSSDIEVLQVLQIRVAPGNEARIIELSRASEVLRRSGDVMAPLRELSEALRNPHVPVYTTSSSAQ